MAITTNINKRETKAKEMIEQVDYIAETVADEALESMYSEIGYLVERYNLSDDQAAAAEHDVKKMMYKALLRKMNSQ